MLIEAEARKQRELAAQIRAGALRRERHTFQLEPITFCVAGRSQLRACRVQMHLGIQGLRGPIGQRNSLRLALDSTRHRLGAGTPRRCVRRRAAGTLSHTRSE